MEFAADFVAVRPLLLLLFLSARGVLVMSFLLLDAAPAAMRVGDVFADVDTIALAALAAASVAVAVSVSLLPAHRLAVLLVLLVPLVVLLMFLLLLLLTLLLFRPTSAVSSPTEVTSS